MSHELRTPLNSSLILAKLLAENKDGTLTAEQVKFAETIYSAGNDLLTLINDILDLAKIEAGRMTVDVASVPVARLVDPMRATFEAMATQKGITFRVEVKDAGTITTDVQKVEQVLKNLLSNAIKFTDTGSVTLVATADGESVRFAVTDTGIGIAKDQLAPIFEAFRQAESTSSRRYGGTGLGLSISRDLARLLGGTVTVESTVGRGSTFTLALPRTYTGTSGNGNGNGAEATPPASPPRPMPASPQEPPRRSVETPPTPSVAAPHVPDDRDTLDDTRRRVLIVEDDVPFAGILVDLVRERGFAAIATSMADDGVALAKKFAPDAIILDVNLPDHSGLSVLDRLKRTPATRHVPVYVVSVADHSRTARAMGAVGYALKPVKREQLAQALEELAGKWTSRTRRVLVVEDDEVQRSAIEKLLASRDVEIIGAGTVPDALAHLKSTTFDCVVTDLGLPGASGDELLRKMAEDTANSFPPVIVYTGRSLTHEEEQRLRKYSSSIIVKGARSPERLLDEVTLFLHHVESELPPERQKMLRHVRDREAVFEGRHILLVEDDVRNVFALTAVLEPKGAIVDIARNGKEALRALEEKPGVEIVLMDIMMPEMDGITCMREIRKNKAWAKLPIIALTAKAMKDDQERCLDAGANDFISKPLDVEKLLSLLRVWMPK
jgi:CheY-like chemotaxis protein